MDPWNFYHFLDLLAEERIEDYRIGFLSTPIIKFVHRATRYSTVSEVFQLQNEGEGEKFLALLFKTKWTFFLRVFFGPSSLNYGVYRRYFQTVKIQAKPLRLRRRWRM